MSASSSLEIYRYPVSFPKSGLYSLRINGRFCPVLHDALEDFACFGFEGPVEVEIVCPEAVDEVQVLPRRLKLPVTVDGQSVRIELRQPEDLSVKINGLKHLFLFMNPPETVPVEDERTRVYRAGQIYEIGQEDLKSGERVHIEGGAIVKGAFRIHDAEDVRITGFGVLDNSFFTRRVNGRVTLHPLRSRNLRISGITIIRPSAWTLAMWECDDVVIDGIREITYGNGSDGIDIVSSEDVTVRNCFLRCGDDCVVIKATRYNPERKVEEYSAPARRASRNILVEGCRLHNHGGGSALEIGHELRCEVVENITFRDCDIIAVHGHGAALCINAGEQATVRNVLYEDIRIDHYYEFLLHFRVMKSRYSRMEQRGQIRDVTLRNITVHDDIVNPGYSISVIGGFNPEHTVENVTIENLTRNGVKVTNLAELDCYIRDAHNIVFK